MKADHMSRLIASIPAQRSVQNLCSSLNVGSQQHVDRQRLEQVGETAPRFRPWQVYLLYPMLGTRYPWPGGVQVGQKLATAQVPPNPLAQVVIHRKCLTTVRARKTRPARALNVNVNLLPLHVQIDSFHRPGLVHTKQAPIQLFAFQCASPLQDMRSRLPLAHTKV